MINIYDNVAKFDLIRPGSVTGPLTVEDCEDAWNELTPTGCTITAGATNKVVGTNCVKIAMDGTATTGIIASEVVSLDLSTYYYISMYIMPTVGVDAGDLALLIDESAQCASPDSVLDLPALRAGVMNHVILGPIAEATSTRNAIISVGLRMDRDLGACDIYIDHLEAWKDLPYYSAGVDVRDYEGDCKLVLDVTGNSAGTTKTLDIAMQESDYQYSGYAAMSPVLAFTQVTTSPGSEQLQVDLTSKKRYIRALVTLGSADCVYTLALHGYGQKKYLGY